jgi:hypothetical protein
MHKVGAQEGPAAPDEENALSMSGAGPDRDAKNDVCCLLKLQPAACCPLICFRFGICDEY